MNKLVYLFSVILMSTAQFTNAQNHTIGVSYDYIFGSSATQFATLDGGSSFHLQEGKKISLNYSYVFTKSVRLSSGLQFQQSDLQAQNASTSGKLQTWDFTVRTINIPVLANFNYLNYLLVEAGPLLNLQVNGTDLYGIDRQNGIGFLSGLGAKYRLKKISGFIKYQYQMQSLFPFNKERYHDRLITHSLSVGLHYHL